MTRPTAYRLLMTLVSRDYVHVDDDSHYSLGYKLLALSQAMLDSMDLPGIAQPFLQHLSAYAQETAYLSILKDTEIIYISKVEGPQAVQLRASVGSRNDIYS